MQARQNAMSYKWPKGHFTIYYQNYDYIKFKLNVVIHVSLGFKK